MRGPFFETKFTNNTDSPWVFRVGGPKPLVTVAPQSESLVESYTPFTAIARWAEIELEKNGNVAVTENPRWMFPWTDYEWKLELLNIDGPPVQSLRVLTPNPLANSDGYAHALRGIPLLIPLRLDDPLIRFKVIKWMVVEEKRRLGSTPYYHTHKVLKRVEQMRSDKELMRIFNQRKAIADEAHEAEQLRRLPELGLMMAADAYAEADADVEE